MWRPILPAFAALALTAACGRGDAPASAERHGDEFLRCAEPYDDGRTERFELSPLVVERRGLDLEVKGLSRGVVILGALAGISDPTPATLRNVDLFLGELKRVGAQAILVPGGVGLTESAVKTILGRLAAAPVPVLVSPGAEESHDVFRAAMAELRQTRPQLVDMTRVRRVRIGNVQIVSLPGYHKPFHLAAGDRGCAYQAADLAATFALFDPAAVGVLLSASPPRGFGAAAVDRGRGDVNMGDPALAAALAARRVRFGVFGYAYESGGHGTRDDGRTPVKPGVFEESLFLEVGAAEAVPLTLTGEGRSVGMAEVLEISGNRMRFQTIPAEGAAGK